MCAYSEQSERDFTGPGTGSLKLHASIAIAALKAGRDKEFALWVELRKLNESGSGHLPYAGLVERLTEVFGYSESTVYRLLRAGKGKFWEFEIQEDGVRQELCIYSLEQVSRKLDIGYVTRPVLVPISQWQTRRSKRSFLYASFYHPSSYHKPLHPVSRASLEVATGVQRRQQLRYETTARVSKTVNKAFNEDGQPILRYYSGKSVEYLCQRQLPNVYQTQLELGATGITRKVNRRLRNE